MTGTDPRTDPADADARRASARFDLFGDSPGAALAHLAALGLALRGPDPASYLRRLDASRLRVVAALAGLAADRMGAELAAELVAAGEG